MAPRDPMTMSKAELVAEVKRLQELFVDDETLRATIVDLEVHRDELTAAQEELYHAQHLLEISRDEYAALFDFAPVGYVVLDVSGVVTQVNFAAARLFGLERGRMIGFPFVSFVLKEQRQAILAFIRRGRLMQRNGPDSQTMNGREELEVTLRRPHGQAVPVLLTLDHLGRRPSTGQPMFRVIITDLTERKRAEEERRQAEEERRQARLQENLARAEALQKDRFIAVLSHELRTPLAPIRFATASLRRSGAVPEQFQHALEVIDRNVEHEARMIEDLLDVTRIAQKKLRLQLATVDVHELLEEVAAAQAPEIQRDGIRLAIELGAGRHHVCADDGRLRQVVANLLRNAAASTPAGGQITLRTSNPGPDRVAISVRDNGQGISREELPRLFLPFALHGDPQRPSKGLGLGLSICKGIIDEHQGEITAASDGPGMGAIFTIALSTIEAPRPAERDTARVVEPAEPRRGRAGLKILLVEDNADNAESTAMLLEMLGHHVSVAGSVQAALRAADQEFDVLVSDIGLPDGNGRDLMRELSARRPVRGIALTGYGTTDDLLENARAGFARHLVKPVNPDALVRAIDELAQDPLEAASRSRRG